MAFDINQFRSSFHNYEPASPANYEVIIAKEPFRILSSSDPYTVIGNNTFNDMARQLAYRCESCSLPSRSLTASNRITYGAPKKVVSGSIFNNVNFSFIVSDDMSEKHYFYQWQNYILNNTSVDAQENPLINDVAYYGDYAGTILINTFSKFGDIKYSVFLEDAYPISVQEVQLGWNSTNDYVRVNVTMAYRYFHENKEDIRNERNYAELELMRRNGNTSVNLDEVKITRV